MEVRYRTTVSIPIICQGVSVLRPCFLMYRQIVSRQMSLDPFLNHTDFARKLSFSFFKFKLFNFQPQPPAAHHFTFNSLYLHSADDDDGG